MKLSSSSSSAAPPSSSSFSFDSKSAVSGCLAGILHRILCSRSLPTYPSDQITESCSIVSRDQELEETKQNNREYEAVAAPGVVARLMGLESMSNMRPDSITRSRSMNSLDCCNKGLGMDQMQGEHRRVKSSTFSVSEIPAFLELEVNEDFLVLNFENGSEEETKRRRKISSSRRKKPDTTTTTTSSLPGFENPECSTPVKNRKEESESENVKFRKNKKKKKMNNYVENDSSSEDSSPVSVLDFDQFITDHEVPRSELESNLVESNSRRKLSPELGELEYYENRIRRNDSNLMISDEDTNAKNIGSGNRGSCSSTSWQSQSNYMEMWDQICKMTDEAEEEEEEIIGGSKWWFLKKHHHEEFEQICADFEFQIVDQSLDELVQQLVGLIT